MNNLSTHFKKLSLLDKIKFIVFFPILMLLNDPIELLRIITDWLIRLFCRYRQEILVIIVPILMIAISTSIVVHIDRTVPAYKGTTRTQVREYVYTNCHQMANNFIIAEDGKVRGYIRADDRNIDRLIDVIVEYDFDDKDKLIKSLTAFRNGDYSSAVEFHNYCWEKLDGEVGYAVDIRAKYK